MKSFLSILALCFAVVGCGTSRWGIVNVPPEKAGSDATALEAIKHALTPEESTCNVELVQAHTPDQASPSTVMQVLTVKVCGKNQKFSIQRSQTKPDNVLVSATKI
jgi:hypothetical protein